MGAGFLTAGSVIFSSFNNDTQTTTSKTLGDHFDELEDLYNANEAFNMETFVQKPTDWSGIPLGQGASNLKLYTCLLYTSPSPRDATLSRMPSSA